MHGPFSARHDPAAHAHAAHALPTTTTREPHRPTAALAGTACPRCDTPLIDPESLGLCRRCGYCRALAQAPPFVAVPHAAPRWASALGLVGVWQQLCLVPAGTWLILGATLTVLPLSYLADHRLSPASRERALWSTVQLGVGLAVLLA